jgi:hypothetical protein
MDPEGKEQGNIGKQEISPKKAFMLRFADGGEPISISVNAPSKVRINERTGFREEKTQASINPKLTEKLPVGSLLNLGEGQTFQIVEPSRATQASNPKEEGIFVKRIPPESTRDLKGKLIEGYNQLKDNLIKAGKNEMIFEIEAGTVPLEEETAKFFPTPVSVPTPVNINKPVKVGN